MRRGGLRRRFQIARVAEATAVLSAAGLKPSLPQEAGLALASLLFGIPGVEVAVLLPDSSRLFDGDPVAARDVGLNLGIRPGSLGHPHLPSEAVLGHTVERVRRAV